MKSLASTTVFIAPISTSAIHSLNSRTILSSSWRPTSARWKKVSCVRTSKFDVHHYQTIMGTNTPTSASAAYSSSSQQQSLATTAPKTATITRKTFARGETFSRRRIGLYELKQEGVDPSVIFKRTNRFEIIYGTTLISFIGIFFVIPVVTNTPLREDIISAIVALLMSLYAVDTLALNGTYQSTIIAKFQDKKRIIQHEAAHVLAAHLLGFELQSVVLPFAKNVYKSKTDENFHTGVEIKRCWAQNDIYRVAAIGLAGFAAELLIYHNAYGIEDDISLVGKQIKLMNEDNELSDEDVKGIVRWGLLVSTRMIKQHCVAFQHVVDALTNEKDVEHCINIIDKYANDNHLVAEPFAPV